MRIKAKPKFFVFALLGILSIVISVFVFRDKLVFWSYDLINSNNAVVSYKEARFILDQYPKVVFSDLPQSIQSGFSFQNHTANKSKFFYVIPKKDLYKKIYFNNRILQLATKEHQFSGFWQMQSGSAYLCINDKLIESAFHLSDSLLNAGYDPYALHINSGFRSPRHNRLAGGAPLSQHLYGTALDLSIGDINRDRKADVHDKNIVRNILDSSVIANKGGVGFYPGTMVLHMDVRGHGARWNKYKQKK
jgi:hypothetical protein